MVFSDREEKIINNEMSKLKNAITLRVVTDYKTSDEGKKTRQCLSCNSIMSILNELANASQGKLKIKELSTHEDQEFIDKFDVKRIPTIIFLDDNGKEMIRYTAVPDGNQLVGFIKTLQFYSGVSPFYKDQIKTNMANIEKSEITMFVTHTCPYCPQVIPIANLFALVSDGKIKVEVIDINSNQDIAQKYNISSVPNTMINKKDNLYGLFTPQDLLDKLTKGERDFGGMYA
jgi:glutaredoxin-like protein